MNSPVIAICVGWLVTVHSDRVGWRRWVGGVVGVTVWLPPLGVALSAVATIGLVARSRLLRQHAAREADAHVGLLARSMLISVSAGMSTVAALALAAEHVHPLLAAEVRAVLGESQRHGLAAALSEANGRAERLYLLLARAQVTGASTAGTLAAFVEERREAERVGSVERARKLPVKLTIPLALLILPGFVVLTVGPSVLVAGRQLLGPVIP